jgi:glycosyltransferase involved in cell wall biosynthesis
MLWPLLKAEANRVKIYETEIARWFDRVTMVSSLDREYLLSINSDIPVSVVPMGVDLEYFQPNSVGDEPNLLFTGIMQYFPNADAVQYFHREIFPLVKRAVPKAKFYIVGNSPTKKVVKLASDDDVTVTGRVDDVRPYFDKSAVFVCPLRSGSGMQTKILEAMAMEVPVVTTSLGFEALEATSGREIIVADGAEKFAREVIRLLKDKELRQTITQNAREFVESRYGWPSVVRRLDAVYEDITGIRSESTDIAVAEADPVYAGDGY